MPNELPNSNAMAPAAMLPPLSSRRTGEQLRLGEIGLPLFAASNGRLSGPLPCVEMALLLPLFEVFHQMMSLVSQAPIRAQNSAESVQ